MHSVYEILDLMIYLIIFKSNINVEYVYNQISN